MKNGEMNQELKKLKKYIIFKNSAGGCALFFGVIFFVGMLAVMISGLADLEESGGLVFVGGAGALIMGVLIYKSLLQPHVQSAKQEKAWRKSGEIEQIIDDFTHAQADLAPDVARLGETYLFARGTGTLIKYEDIKSARVIVIKTNGAVLETDLVAELSNGKSVVVCKVPKIGAMTTAMYKVVAAIQKHNPDFKLKE